MKNNLRNLVNLMVLVCILAFPILAQTSTEKAEAVLKRAIAKVGGDKYLQVKTTIGKGLFTTFREGESGTPSSFVDYLVFPNKERTEFKSASGKFIQTNVGETGWVYDGTTRSINDQTPEQIANFKKAMRTSLDYLLRGYWRSEKDVKLEYVGKREAGLGKRNEVIKIAYEDGLAIEFEFAATDALPMKSVYKEKNPEGEETKQEDRYAQFVEVQGVLVPYIIDHFQNGKQSSRINYQSVEINAVVPDTLFTKPIDVKKLK
jgi:outer membrane lipoprotein-sorting protein